MIQLDSYSMSLMPKERLYSWVLVLMEDFTSPLCTPNLPFIGARRMKNIRSNHQDDDIITEHTGEPTGNVQTYENKDDFSASDTQDSNFRKLNPCKRGRKPTSNDSSTKITAFLENILVATDDEISVSEYLNVTHVIDQIKKDEDIEMDKYVNLLDFIPEPRSLIQILRMSSFIIDK